MGATTLSTNVTLVRTPNLGRLKSTTTFPAALIPSSAYDVTNTPLTSQTIKGTHWYDSFLAKLTLTSLDGAGNTIDIYVQGLDPDGVTWFDILNMPNSSLTSAGTYYLSYGGKAGVWQFAKTDGAITSGTTNTVCIPSQMRVKLVLAGTVTITFALWIEFYGEKR